MQQALTLAAEGVFFYTFYIYGLHLEMQQGSFPIPRERKYRVADPDSGCFLSDPDPIFEISTNSDSVFRKWLDLVFKIWSDPDPV